MDNSEFRKLVETNEVLNFFKETGNSVNVLSEDIDTVMGFLFNLTALEGGKS
jgi:hypothetical protein